jgi:hypothetical protein
MLDLSLEASSLVVFPLVQKKSCPALVLERLMRCYDRTIIEWVSLHPNCSTSIVEKLLRDHHTHIRERARRHPNAPKELVGLLNNLPTIQVEQLVFLAEGGYLSNREIATHPLYTYDLPIRFVPPRSRFFRAKKSMR